MAIKQRKQAIILLRKLRDGQKGKPAVTDAMIRKARKEGHT